MMILEYTTDKQVSFATAWSKFEEQAKQRYTKKYEEYRGNLLDPAQKRAHLAELFNLFCRSSAKPDLGFLDQGLVVEVDSRVQFINPLAAAAMWKYLKDGVNQADFYTSAMNDVRSLVILVTVLRLFPSPQQLPTNLSSFVGFLCSIILLVSCSCLIWMVFLHEL